MEPDRKRRPVGEIPQRKETERPRALRRGPVQARERSGQRSACPGAPSDRKDPWEDARAGGPRMVAATWACRADPGGEEARSGSGKCRGGRVVPQLARTSWARRDPAPHTVGYVLGTGWPGFLLAHSHRCRGDPNYDHDDNHAADDQECVVACRRWRCRSRVDNERALLNVVAVDVAEVSDGRRRVRGVGEGRGRGLTRNRIRP